MSWERQISVGTTASDFTLFVSLRVIHPCLFLFPATGSGPEPGGALNNAPVPTGLSRSGWIVQRHCDTVMDSKSVVLDPKQVLICICICKYL